ncbi:MAG: ABC transporter ATP-binding protein [Bacillota bacterium]
MRTFTLVKSYLLSQKTNFFFFIFLSFTVWLLSISLPYLTGRYINILINTKERSRVYNFTAILAVILALDIILSFLKSMAAVKIKTKASFELNLNLFEHIKRLPLPYLGSINTKCLTDRINMDSRTVAYFTVDNLINVFTGLLSFIFIGFFALTVNKIIALFLFILVPVYAIVYLVFKEHIQKRERDYNEKQNKLSYKMNEQTSKVRLIKINSWFDVLSRDLKAAFNDVLKSAFSFTKISSMYSGMSQIISHLTKISFFLVGGLAVLNNKMTIGEFITINAYFYILLECTSYFMDLGRSYQETLVSYVRIKEILDMKPEPNGKEILNSVNQIELRDVSFSFDKRKYILNGLNCKFKRGNVYCITGRSGIAKNTFIDLMTGLVIGYTGDILYNSTNIKDLDLYSLRENLIGVSEQDPALFNDSILNNLTYGLKEYDIETINKVCEKVNVQDWVNQQPNGLDSHISEDINSISKGNKKRFSLARMLLKDTDVLIFDDPVSANDQCSLTCFKNVIEELRGNKIIIIITRCEGILDMADEIISLHDEVTEPSYAGSFRTA